MSENSNHTALKAEIEQGRFVRAALLAAQHGLPEDELQELRCKAIGQISVVYRNPHGAKALARKYGFTREAVKEVLEAFVDEMKKEDDTKPLEPCYDCSTGRYLSFEEWMDHYLKTWNKLPE